MTRAARPRSPARRSAAIFVFVAGVAAQASAWAAVPSIDPHADVTVDTIGKVRASGRTLRYRATAGQYPIRANATGAQQATMFFVAYVVPQPPGAPSRPLTFLWNGGPGSSSAQLHIVGFGPKRIATPGRYPEWAAARSTPIVDNPETWLASSDLVFVDPIGTGFSRLTDARLEKIFYTTRGDAEAMAEFIRIYLNRNERWGSPLFIAGESYGTNRAMAVAEALEIRNTHLAGVVLISGGFDLGQRTPIPLNRALGISRFAATGHYFGLLSPEIQKLERDEAVRRAVDWARTTWAPALANPNALSDVERQAIKNGLRRYTGIDPRFVDDRALTIEGYLDQLLRDRGLELGHFDSRMTTAFRGEGIAWLPTRDPSLRPMLPLINGSSTVFNAYIRRTLGFRSDLLYQGPWGGAFHPEPLQVDAHGLGDDWASRKFVMGDYDLTAAEAARGENGPPAPEETGRPPTREPALHRAMTLNPSLHVENLTGMYDNSCAAKDEAVARTEPAFRRRIVNHCYAGGHMWYADTPVRRQAQRDFAAFVHAAIRPNAD